MSEIIRKQLKDLLAGAGNSAQYSYKGKDEKIFGITDDTRNISEGYIFICVKGANFDGHTAAAGMLEKGAAAVVCDHDIGLKEKQILVKDTREFYGLLTAEWFDHPEKQLMLVGVTGTNGKTTMTTMIHHILTGAGAKAGLIGTAETLCGKEPMKRDESTPTTPKVFEFYQILRKMVDSGCHYCVMEVSSFALEQQRIGPAVFTCSVFSNLTRDHLDYHGTMENYYLAKKKLFDRTKIAFINTEDPYGERLYKEISCSKFSYGLKGNTSVYASFAKFADGETRFWFCFPGKSFQFSIKMMGSYNVANATAAIAVCSKLNVPMVKIGEALSKFNGVRGRCEIIPTKKDFQIICDYAHSPDALENMLPCIRENCSGRLICLFGCGGDRDKTKRPLMAKAAAKFADYLIITSDNPRNEEPDAIIDDIIAGLEGSNVPYDRITDRRKAIHHAVRMARKGDIIVLAGKGHEDYQILSGNVHIHFDEREICAEALNELSLHNTGNASELYSGMSIDDICKATGGKKVNIPDTARYLLIERISSDTRTIRPESAFIAFKGENHDGHDFVPDAIRKGAVCAITERPISNFPCIVVESTARAILHIAASYRSRFHVKLVGITGSVGKTTTKEMTALALSSKYNTLKTEGNHNNEIGMPFTLLGLTADHKAAVIEMGMSHFGEIERLSKTCRPTIAMITNIGWSHAENLGDQQGILKAKLEILKGADPKAPLIINGDDPLLYPLAESVTDRTVITCGVKNKDCTYHAEEIHMTSDTTEFTVFGKEGALDRMTLHCIGEHHIMDALLAYAAAVQAGCDGSAVCEALEEFKLSGLRQHTEIRKGQTVIIDCYNAAPNSMKAAINVLCEMEPVSGGKRVAVLGDMLELGTRSPELHEKVGAYAAEKGIDIVVCYGQYAAYIAKGAEKGGAVTCYSESKEKILNYLNFKLAEGDVVLYKASRGIKMEEIIKEYYGE